MAITYGAAALTTTPSKIVTATGDLGASVLVLNSAAVTVRLGGSSGSISSTVGFPLAAGAAFAYTIQEVDDDLWAAAASGTPSVDIIKTGT